MLEVLLRLSMLTNGQARTTNSDLVFSWCKDLGAAVYAEYFEKTGAG